MEVQGIVMKKIMKKISKLEGMESRTEAQDKELERLYIELDKHDSKMYRK